MAKLTASIDVRNVDAVKTLIDLLAHHIDELPAPVVEALKRLA